MWAPAKWVVDNILSVLGATGNTGGTATAGTAMAKLNSLITTAGTINSNASSSYSALTNGTYGLSAINSKINALGGAVRSVQRGRITSITGQTINISSVTMSKSLALISSVHASSGSAGYITLDLSSSTQLTLKLTASFSSGELVWQVIEFY